MWLFIVLLLHATPLYYAAPLLAPEIEKDVKCGEQGDCISVSTDCNNICGCDNIFYYNETSNECLLNKEYLQIITAENNNTEEKIRSAAEKVFNGIFISVILFITCASTCALTACIYCCRVSYMDQKLRSDVEALAKKLHRDGKLQKSTKQRTQPVADSCNVIDAEAGLFVC